MCGFGGYVGSGSRQILEEMTVLLVHRGPDWKDVWMRDGIGLAHTRLSILDLTAAGNQPMVSGDGRFVLVYNGEIYNYRELRNQLQQEGEIFLSSSDSEVLLHGYRKWGSRVVEKLRGMFAFGIWDDGRRQLFLARDRLGIKPLIACCNPWCERCGHGCAHSTRSTATVAMSSCADWAARTLPKRYTRPRRV